MINQRILYYMSKRFLHITGYIAVGITAVMLFAGYIWASIALSLWLFGVGFWGLIPVALLIVASSTYPYAAAEYNKEIKMQEKVEKSLKKDWNK